MFRATMRRKQNGFMTSCNHDKYRADNYMMADKALSEIKTGHEGICWMSSIVTHCEYCNADISHAERVRVMDTSEYIKTML